MENEYEGYVEHSIQDYKEGLGAFRNKLPDIGDHFLNFTAACFKSGALNEKEKHLIAVGIGVYSQDEYCIMYHCKQAIDKGATEQEILETIGVCAAFGGGSALAQGVTLVQDVIEECSANKS